MPGAQVRLAILAAGLIACTFILAAALGPFNHPLLQPYNVRIGDDAALRVKTLWALTGQALDELESQKVGENDEAFLRRLDLTRRFMVRVAWYESIQIRARRQVRGPARSFYQIEPIRAKSCCQMAARQGWMDELAAACDMNTATMASACAELSPTAWPRDNQVEACLMTNDRFATVMARICLEPLPTRFPRTTAGQAELWANVWKRAFNTPEQRTKQIAGFVQASEALEPLLPPPYFP
ncbi:MAG: hypothetical protein J5I90_20045 [Caldilineales bacterium]|nr:hypothetical protein [Caldilineales bacterium]